jgi:outer membrane protein, multidrug efflux system
MTSRAVFVLIGIGFLAAGCTVGPDYERPEVSAPAAYRGADDGAQTNGASSFGDQGWWNVFPDPELQALIRAALKENYDLRVAVARIVQARSQVTIAHAQQFPTADASVSAAYSGTSGSDRPPQSQREVYEPVGGFGVAWDIDIWGKFARSTEAARASLLAAEEVRYAVKTTLVAEVAQAYLSLRTLDLALQIATDTVKSREQSRDLVDARLEGGVAGILDLQQAETLLYEATKMVPDLQRQIAQTENYLSILLGKAPGPIARGRPLAEQVAPPAVPTGLPSELLARRPDIRGAEQQLIAANAEIGVAKALLYPQVTITGFAGAQGTRIDGETFGPYGAFSVLPAITLPIFNMGRLRAGVDFNEAVAEEAVLKYRQTITQAFREVSDALVETKKRQESRAQQELLTKTLAEASQIANLRYAGGVSSYLEVLDTERQLFNAQLDLAQAQRDEFLGVVGLYKALGGGWQDEPPAAKPPKGNTAGSAPQDALARG